MIEVFCCYARKDRAALLELKSHLTPLERGRIINLWSDMSIDAGSDWKKEIEWHLKTAQIILLFVSPDFIKSDYCYGTELKQAMERHEREEARVIPIILRPVYWKETLFGGLQALPTDAAPIQSSRWPISDEALLDVVEGIRNVAEELRTKASIKRVSSKAESFSEHTEREDVQGEKKSILISQSTQGDYQQNPQRLSLTSAENRLHLGADEFSPHSVAVPSQRTRHKVLDYHQFAWLRHHPRYSLWALILYVLLSLFIITVLLAQIVEAPQPLVGDASLVYHDLLNNAKNMHTEREEWLETDHCFFSSDGYHVDSDRVVTCTEQGARYQESVISVHMTILNANPAGIVFRNQGDTNTGYYFEIQTHPCLEEITGIDGCYHISILNHLELQKWTPSSAIHAQGSNFLRVIAVGDHLIFFINGQYLMTVVDTRFSAGVIGFACFVPTPYPCKVVFSNLTVDDLSKSANSEK